MPLASPSSLTSNTLATLLDHVPISTNNAEKWKPKQMGSNRGGDYSALSRALSTPLGAEMWIPSCFFLSIKQRQEVNKTVAAICLRVPEMFMARFQSFLFRCERIGLDFHWTLLRIVAFVFYFKVLHITNMLASMNTVHISMARSLWCYSTLVGYSETKKVTMVLYVGHVTCK